jgi:hypothetical protein
LKICLFWAVVETVVINPANTWKSKTLLITWIKNASLWSTHVQMNAGKHLITRIQWIIICNAQKWHIFASSAKWILLRLIKIILKIASTIVWNISDHWFHQVHLFNDD